MAAVAANRMELLECTQHEKEVDDDGRVRKKARDPLCDETCDIDPISLEKIPEDRIIRLKVLGVLRCYDVLLLNEWISDGKWERNHKQPVETWSNIPFSPDQVKRIQKFYKKLKYDTVDPEDDRPWNWDKLKHDLERVDLKEAFDKEVIQAFREHGNSEDSINEFKSAYIPIDFIFNEPASLSKDQAKILYKSQMFQLFFVREDEDFLPLVPDNRNKVFISALPTFCEYIKQYYSGVIPWYFYFFHSVYKFHKNLEENVSQNVNLAEEKEIDVRSLFPGPRYLEKLQTRERYINDNTGVSQHLTLMSYIVSAEFGLTPRRFGPQFDDLNSR